MHSKIAVFTSTRADYGILRPFIKAIHEDLNISMSLMVTGTHLHPDHGMTVNEIELDKFPIDYKIPIFEEMSSKTNQVDAYCKTVSEFSKALSQSKPNAIAILGDRFEAHAAATAAVLNSIPIIHFHGGELTYGAVDEFYRHSITKLSMFHFTSTEMYKKRVEAMGEDPARVFNIGSLSCLNLMEQSFLSKKDLIQGFGIKDGMRLGILTLHPETNLTEELNISMLEAVARFVEKKNDVFFVLTKANADYLGSDFNQRLEKLAKEFPERIYLTSSLGTKRFFSCMKHFDFMLGNSSSGIIESPMFKIPVINIGRRQEGRITAANVISCGGTLQEIDFAFQKIDENSFKENLMNMSNPYYVENALNTVLNFLHNTNLSFGKQFHDVTKG